MRYALLVLVFGVGGCTDGGRAASGRELPLAEPEPKPPELELEPEPKPVEPKPDGCGELSYGIHHNPGDQFEAIAARKLGAIQCATACDPMPSFATRPLGRDHHGGYGFLELDPKQCEFPGMELAVGSCAAICDRSSVIGKFQVRLRDESPAARERLCRAFEARWGPPDVGSCVCLDDDIVWRPSADEPGASLNFLGTYVLDCGFPDGNYLPKFSPGRRR